MKTLWLALSLLLVSCGDDTQDSNSVPCYDVTGDRNQDGKLTAEDCKELNNPKQPTPGSENRNPFDNTSENTDDQTSTSTSTTDGLP